MKSNSPKKKKAGILDNKQDNKQEETCPWYINSPEHKNCLWVYILDKSQPDGSMPELTQSEIAKILGWSTTKTYFMLKQAMQEVIDALNNNKAKQLINTDHDRVVDVKSYDIESTSYTSGDTEE